MGGVLSCGCDVTSCCHNCRPSEICEACYSRACLECSKAKGDCEVCNMFFCNKCAGISPCQACGSQSCQRCQVSPNCADCGKNFCENCERLDNEVCRCKACHDFSAATAEICSDVTTVRSTNARTVPSAVSIVSTHAAKHVLLVARERSGFDLCDMRLAIPSSLLPEGNRWFLQVWR